MNASRIRLVGFDFERVNPKDQDVETKRRKLDWAYVLISALPTEIVEIVT